MIRIDSQYSIKKNTVLLIIQSVILLITGLFTTRLLIAKLGVDAFGTYTLFASISLAFTIFSASSSIAIQRYVSRSLKDSRLDLNEILFSAICIQAIIIFLILLFGFIFNAYVFHAFFDNEIISQKQFILILAFFLLQFCLKVILVPFDALLFSQQKIVPIAIFNVVEGCLKLAALFFVSDDSSGNQLQQLSFLYLVVVISTVTLRIIAAVKIEAINIRQLFRKYNGALFVDMLKFSMWSNAGVIGGVLGNYGPIFLASHYFGAEINAAQGLNGQVTSQTAILSNQFLKNANPKILKDRGNAFLYYSNLSFILTIPLAFFVFFHIDSLLNIWLTEVPGSTIIIIRCTLIAVVSNQIMSPFHTAIRRKGTVKLLEISNLILLALPILISYFIYSQFNQKIEIMYIVIVIGNLIRLMYCFWLIVAHGLCTISDLIESQKFVLFSLSIYAVIFTLFERVFDGLLTSIVELFVSGWLALILAVIFWKYLIKKYETGKTILDIK